MKCPNCGTEAADTQLFCEKCGTALQEKPTADKEVVLPKQAQGATPRVKEKLEIKAAPPIPKLTPDQISSQAKAALNAQRVETSPIPPKQEVIAPQANKAQATNKLLIIGVVVIAILACVAFGMFYISSQNEKARIAEEHRIELAKIQEAKEAAERKAKAEAEAKQAAKLAEQKIVKGFMLSVGDYDRQIAGLASQINAHINNRYDLWSIGQQVEPLLEKIEQKKEQVTSSDMSPADKDALHTLLDLEVTRAEALRAGSMAIYYGREGGSYFSHGTAASDEFDDLWQQFLNTHKY